MNPARLFAALALCAVVTGVALLPPSHRWDTAITAWIQRGAPAPDRPAAALVFLGDAEVMIPAVVLAGLLIGRRDPTRTGPALRLAAGLAGVSVIAFGLKYVVPHPGPSPEFQRAVVRWGVSVTQPFSFPSGHTMRTAFFALTALRRAPVAAGTLVAAMMAALVYLGDHWPSDVLGGLCLALACAELARRAQTPAR
ncbi:MAG TPA: phosphatase PAP2 family protein [bacterium]|nr:phosphatase PAP2 family protein [bacterium]